MSSLQHQLRGYMLGGSTSVPIVLVASVDVSIATQAFAPAATSQITAIPRDVNGFVIVGRTITYGSGTPSVATVGTSGLVTGVANGTAVITVTCDGVQTNVTVVIEAVALVDEWFTGYTGSDDATRTNHFLADQFGRYSTSEDKVLAESAPWAASHAYNVGDWVTTGTGYVPNGGTARQYMCSVAGTSASSGTGPSGTGATIADSGVTWAYQRDNPARVVIDSSVPTSYGPLILPSSCRIDFKNRNGFTAATDSEGGGAGTGGFSGDFQLTRIFPLSHILPGQDVWFDIYAQFGLTAGAFKTDFGQTGNPDLKTVFGRTFISARFQWKTGTQGKIGANQGGKTINLSGAATYGSNLKSPTLPTSDDNTVLYINPYDGAVHRMQLHMRLSTAIADTVRGDYNGFFRGRFDGVDIWRDANAQATKSYNNLVIGHDNWTDLVVTADGSGVSSVSKPFTAADAHKMLDLTGQGGGGSGTITPGLFSIMAVNAGTGVATLSTSISERTCGSANATKGIADAWYVTSAVNAGSSGPFVSTDKDNVLYVQNTTGFFQGRYIVAQVDGVKAYVCHRPGNDGASGGMTVAGYDNEGINTVASMGAPMQYFYGMFMGANLNGGPNINMSYYFRRMRIHDGAHNPNWGW